MFNTEDKKLAKKQKTNKDEKKLISYSFSSLHSYGNSLALSQKRI